jgi:uncharacterized protein YbaP (TraB family)
MELKLLAVGVLRRNVLTVQHCVLAILAILTASNPVFAEPDSTSIFLWEAQTDQGTVAYLLGSLHYATADCYPLREAIERAYSTATTLAVEVDLSKTEMTEVAEWLGRYKGSGRLARDVPAPMLAEIEGLAKKNGWDWRGLSVTRPWVVAQVISGADLEAIGYSRKWGLDLYFINAAKRDGKRIVELETVKEQFTILNSLPTPTQLFLLQDSLNAVKSGDNGNTMAKMINAWSNGDLEGFRVLTEASLADAPDPAILGAKIYGDRNELMAQRIEAMIQKGERPFVVVGAGHLAGPSSLLDALSTKGFRVRQMTAD